LAENSNKLAWKAARAALDIIEAERAGLVAHTQLRYEQTKERLEEVEETHGEPLTFCEGCSDPIFEGEAYHRGSDVDLCSACSPTYGDLAKSPASFHDSHTGEPVSLKSALRTTSKHIAYGGSLDDKMVSP
jgi:hypothetical protein